MIRTKEDALEFFKYKAPNQLTIPKYETVNREFTALVDSLWDVIPDGPGKTRAIVKLAEARMAVNAAIANEGE